MSNLRVGVLRGGPSSEYDVSLQSGAHVLRNLADDFSPVDIFITKQGAWHVGGVEKEPVAALDHVDVVFNALHGTYGEDGKLQKLLDAMSVPYTGSRAVPSAVGMNKALTKKVFERQGIKTPYYTILKRDDVNETTARDLYMHFPQPSVIKPATGGSSLGVTVATSAREIAEAIENALMYSDVIVIEEYIKGKEATCGIVDHFREQERYALMPTEIVDNTSSDIWGYDSKYSDTLHELITPGNFTTKEKYLMQDAAREIHHSLGLRHYSRSDFIVHPKRGVYALEVNTLPGLTQKSLFPHALSASGADMREFVRHAVDLALDGE